MRVWMFVCNADADEDAVCGRGCGFCIYLALRRYFWNMWSYYSWNIKIFLLEYALNKALVTFGIGKQIALF